MTQNINLLPELSIQHSSGFSSKLISEVSIGWILLLALIYIVAFGSYSKKRQNLTILETTQKDLQTKIDTYNKELTTSRGESTGNLPTGSGSTLGFYRYFEDLALFTPHGVWLNYISLSEVDSSVTIKGNTLASSGASALIEALDKAPHFNNKKFSVLQLDKKNGFDNTDFIISTVDPNAPVAVKEKKPEGTSDSSVKKTDINVTITKK